MDDGVLTARQWVSVTSRGWESSRKTQAKTATSVEGTNEEGSCMLQDRASKGRAGQTYELQSPVALPEESGRKYALKQSAERCRPMMGTGNARGPTLFKVELPPLPSIGHINLYPSTTRPAQNQETNKTLHDAWSVTKQNTHSHPSLHSAHSWPSSSPVHDLPLSLGAHLPLTPPQEVQSFGWPELRPVLLPHKLQSLSSEQDNSRPVITGQQHSGNTARPSTISLPEVVTISDQTTSPSTWLERAVSTIVSCHSNDSNSRSQIHMVVQALPSQSKNPARKPAFEEVAENLQQRASNVPYITITHAVSQVVSMEDVPVSPPATPNNQVESDDYFDSQTIFTHAAAVPNYHGLPQTSIPPSSARPSGTIAAPASVHIGTLERYIPPTTAEAVGDFFSISRRSYLVDRLTELSATNGTLLLVYPTQVGGAVFARQYIGPVIDPFLRRFVLLNNLTVDVAAAMGKIVALPKMKTFEEMEATLHDLCRDLTQRVPGRGVRGEYHVLHAEKAEVTLDRPTWVEWFVEQESARLRQNIIDYQKGGGRMPARGFDATPGALAREVVEGIKNSKEEAGGVGIEVGVFVIRRSIV